MNRTFNILVILSAFSVLVPVAAFAQQKDVDAKKDTATKEETTPQDYTSLAQVKEIVGKIADIDIKAGSVTFTVEIPRWEPNPDAKNANQNQQLQQQQQQMMAQYNKIMQMKNAQQKQQALMLWQAQMQQLQAVSGNAANMWRIGKSSKDYEVAFVDKVKVARSKLEKKFTDEGEPIKISATDLKKLKSTDIPGAYIASLEDLRPGLTVKFYLTPPKKQTAKKTDAAKSDDKDNPSGALAARPQVRMLLIMEDANAADAPDAPKKKNNR
jgi:hypothetical protein